MLILNNVKIDCRKRGGGVNTKLNNRFIGMCEDQKIIIEMPIMLLHKAEYLYVTDVFSLGIQKLIGFSPLSTYFDISECREIHIN